MEKGNLKWEELENKIVKKKDEEIDNNLETNKNKNKESNKKIILYSFIICIILLALIVFSTIFAIMNINNNNIISGVKIQGIDVSGLSANEAKSKIELIYNEKNQKDILLKYEEYDTTINSELLETNYDIEKAVEEAISTGKQGNIIKNNYDILSALVNKKNIDVNMTINEDIAKQTINDISTNIPGAVVEADYYIENDKLIITKGKEGLNIDTEDLIEKIKKYLIDTNLSQEYIEIPIINKIPDKIDIDKIYEEVHKEVKDAYYTKDPFTIYPEVEGVDFNLEEARAILQEDKEQYEINLIITKPKVTISQIGSEAFPDLLGTYSTRYDASLIDRSTNLRLACQKINDKVVLPGEVFSYNKTLGERTVAAGYRNAKVYENGEVVDGIGGGICQISSTLYNAILIANMEATERRNHQFITSYAPAGRDATVVYGLTDFKFKNTRTYAVRIKATCSNGIATVSIYGIKEENEYAVSFSTRTLSTIPYTVQYVDDNTLPVGKEKVKQGGANGVITETYITKSLNGKVVSSKLLSKDTYNAMQRIILRGTKGATTNTANPNTTTETSIPAIVENNPNPVVTEEKPTETAPTENTNNNETVKLEDTTGPTIPDSSQEENTNVENNE